MTRDNFNFS